MNLTQGQIDAIRCIAGFVTDLAAAPAVVRAVDDAEFEYRVRELHRATYLMCERFCAVTGLQMGDFGIAERFEVSAP